MSTVPARLPRVPRNGLPLLVNGDRMKQPEFHQRYEQYPVDVRFELVGGIVYQATPRPCLQGEYLASLSGVFGVYQSETPGVQAANFLTVILGEESEPQPDVSVCISPEYGGQSGLNDGYVVGAPELLAEVGHSSRGIDMHQKRDDYRRAGVCEYVVLCVEERELHWFQFPSGEEIRPNRRGVIRSAVFPGLWIHVQALLNQDLPSLIEVVQQGLASRAHAAFVRRLQAARRRS